MFRISKGLLFLVLVAGYGFAQQTSDRIPLHGWGVGPGAPTGSCYQDQLWIQPGTGMWYCNTAVTPAVWASAGGGGGGVATTGSGSPVGNCTAAGNVYINSGGGTGSPGDTWVCTANGAAYIGPLQPTTVLAALSANNALTGQNQVTFLNGNYVLPNSATGTTLNQPVILVVNAGAVQAQVAGSGATSGIVGIAIAGAGTTGNVTVAVFGPNVLAAFTGATTAGDYVTMGTGGVQDAGAACPAGQAIGKVGSTNAGAGTYGILLDPHICSGGGLPAWVAVDNTNQNLTVTGLNSGTGYNPLTVTSPNTAATRINVINTATSGRSWALNAGATASGDTGQFSIIDNTGGSYLFSLGAAGGGALSAQITGNRGWCWVSSTLFSNTNPDTCLWRTAAGTIAIGNGTSGNASANVSVGVSIGGVNTVASSATPAFDLSLGNTQYIAALGINATMTVSNIKAGATYKFIICQDATGSRTFAWAAAFHGAMTIGATASKCSAQDFTSPDGTNIYALSPGVTNQ